MGEIKELKARPIHPVNTPRYYTPNLHFPPGSPKPPASTPRPYSPILHFPPGSPKPPAPVPTPRPPAPVPTPRPPAPAPTPRPPAPAPTPRPPAPAPIVPINNGNNQVNNSPVIGSGGRNIPIGDFEDYNEPVPTKPTPYEHDLDLFKSKPSGSSNPSKNNIDESRVYWVNHNLNIPSSLPNVPKNNGNNQVNNTPIIGSGSTNIPLDGPVDAPVDAPVSTPVSTPVNTPIGTPVDTSLGVPQTSTFDDKTLIIIGVLILSMVLLK